jgi:hypothetical protein
MTVEREVLQQYWWVILIILVLAWLFLRPSNKRTEDAGEAP